MLNRLTASKYFATHFLMPSKIDEKPIFIGLSTKSEFFADLDEEPRFGDQIKKKSKQSC